MQSTRFLLGFVLASPMLAQLQSRPPVLQLSLKQAVQIALAPEGSTRVKLAEEAVKQAERRAGTRAEAGDGDRRSVGQVADCVGRRGTQLVHVPSLRPRDRSD